MVWAVKLQSRELIAEECWRALEMSTGRGVLRFAQNDPSKPKIRNKITSKGKGKGKGTVKKGKVKNPTLAKRRRTWGTCDV